MAIPGLGFMLGGMTIGCWFICAEFCMKAVVGLPMASIGPWFIGFALSIWPFIGGGGLWKG